MKRIIRRAALAALAAVGVTYMAWAADILVYHDPGTYKMSKFYVSGDSYPLNGPVIRVFSKTGAKYDAIANDNENLTHASRVGAVCTRTKKIDTADVTVAGVSRNVHEGRNNSLRRKTVAIELPFAVPNMPRSPVAACNFELEKRAAQGGKSRTQWLKSGFVVKYDGAYEATFTVTCTGIGRGDFSSETISTPVWIACEPSRDAGKKPQKAELKKPRGKSMPLKVSARLEASKSVLYAPKCPTSIHFTGSIWASKPGTTVKYQIVGSDWTSPERTMTFKKAERQEVVGWTKRFDVRKAGANSLAAPSVAGAPDADGWARVKVKFAGGRAESEKVPYKVYCNAAPPRRLQIKKTPQ